MDGARIAPCGFPDLPIGLADLLLLLPKLGAGKSRDVTLERETGGVDMVYRKKITLKDVQEEEKKPSDIYLHLTELYDKVIETKARIVVELGVRTGISTKAFLAGVHDTGGVVYSLDLDERCRKLFSSRTNRWVFVPADSRSFDWGSYCAGSGAGAPPNIDVLFIDTEHTFECTTRELEHWVPFVREGGYVLCHDTIHHPGNPPQIGGSGVLRPVLDMMEANPGHFQFQHRDYCNGLAVLKKTGP